MMLIHCNAYLLVYCTENSYELYTCICLLVVM